MKLRPSGSARGCTWPKSVATPTCPAGITLKVDSSTTSTGTTTPMANTTREAKRRCGAARCHGPLGAAAMEASAREAPMPRANRIKAKISLPMPCPPGDCRPSPQARAALSTADTAPARAAPSRSACGGLRPLLHEAQQARDEEHGLRHEGHEQEDGDDSRQEGHERLDDLLHGQAADGHAEEETEAHRWRDVPDGRGDHADHAEVDGVDAERLGAGQEHRRSEERRVGKECRSRWSPYH